MKLPQLEGQEIEVSNFPDVSWDSERIVNVTVPASEQTSWTVRSLSPDTIYYFRISAVNEIGLGAPSTNLVKMRTEEEVPAGPPTNVYVQAVGPNSLRVSWNVSRLYTVSVESLLSK